jgi:hypothetical protein
MEQWSDPDPGSGISKQNLLIAFMKKEVGSGIRCFFTPRIRCGAMVGSGIRDKTSRIRNTEPVNQGTHRYRLMKKKQRVVNFVILSL